MVGKADMGLFGWKQLVLWSLEHACLSPNQYGIIKHEWDGRWQEFLLWVVKTYESELRQS